MAKLIEDWKRRLERGPRTLVWTLAGLVIGVGLAFLTAVTELVLILLVGNHLQPVQPALAWTQGSLWPLSLPWWDHPAIGDLSWWRGVFGNATIFAGVGAILAEIRLGYSD